MKLTGKIKSIPIAKPVEGMQVIAYKVLCVIRTVTGDNIYLNEKERELLSRFSIEDLKTFVVEYEIHVGGNNVHQSYFVREYKIKQLPLNPTQWQYAIDNGLVDSNKTVEFTIKKEYAFHCVCSSDPTAEDNCLAGINCKAEGNWKEYVSINIAEKKLYTKEEMEELREALAGILDIGKRNTENPKYDGYYNTAKEVIKKFY